MGDRYDYESAVKSDIADWLKENGDRYADEDGTISERAEERINDVLWTSDSVTGNGSGSYTMSTWQSEENLCHNGELIDEVISEFGEPDAGKFNDAEFWDVSIRCMLMSRLLHGCVEEYNEKHGKEEE